MEAGQPKGLKLLQSFPELKGMDGNICTVKARWHPSGCVFSKYYFC